MSILPQLWSDDSGQDIAEYAVMLAVILVLVVGTIHTEQPRNPFWTRGLFVLGNSRRSTGVM